MKNLNKFLILIILILAVFLITSHFKNREYKKIIQTHQSNEEKLYQKIVNINSLITPAPTPTPIPSAEIPNNIDKKIVDLTNIISDSSEFSSTLYFSPSLYKKAIFSRYSYNNDNQVYSDIKTCNIDRYNPKALPCDPYFLHWKNNNNKSILLENVAKLYFYKDHFNEIKEYLNDNFSENQLNTNSKKEVFGFENGNLRCVLENSPIWNSLGTYLLSCGQEEVKSINNQYNDISPSQNQLKTILEFYENQQSGALSIDIIKKYDNFIRASNNGDIIYKKINGKWQRIQWTQSEWNCETIFKHDVPIEITGDFCYHSKIEKHMEFNHKTNQWEEQDF